MAGLRIMSWNLRGAAKPRLDSVVEIVQAHEPDVLALQEVRRGQARRIAGLLGWRRPAWALKHNPYWPAWWLAEGLALLSHHRLAVHPPVVLTPEINRRTFRRRILLPAEVLLEDDQRVLVIDAHLSSGDDDELRVRQAHHVLSILPDSLPTWSSATSTPRPGPGRSRRSSAAASSTRGRRRRQRASLASRTRPTPRAAGSTT